MPIREIARRTGLSRNTVKKYLREGAVEPNFKTPSRPSKLDPYAGRLSIQMSTLPDLLAHREVHFADMAVKL